MPLKSCSKCHRKLELETNFRRSAWTNAAGEKKTYWTRVCNSCRSKKRRGKCDLCKRDNQTISKGICSNCYFQTAIAPNPERLRAFQIKSRERHLLRKYKMTLAEYDALLAKQDGKCAICGATNNGKTRDGKSDLPLMVDHDHATGKNRGLLCAACNFLVGLLEASQVRYESAKAYLEKYRDSEAM